MLKQILQCVIVLSSVCLWAQTSTELNSVTLSNDVHISSMEPHCTIASSSSLFLSPNLLGSTHSSSLFYTDGVPSMASAHYLASAISDSSKNVSDSSQNHLADQSAYDSVVVTKNYLTLGAVLSFLPVNVIMGCIGTYRDKNAMQLAIGISERAVMAQVSLLWGSVTQNQYFEYYGAVLGVAKTDPYGLNAAYIGATLAMHYSWVLLDIGLVIPNLRITEPLILVQIGFMPVFEVGSTKRVVHIQ